MADPTTSSDEELGDYQSLLERARSAGFSWGEIGNHVASSTAAAADAGYTQPEIDQHLGFVDPAGFESSAKASWATAMADDPALIDGLADGKINLAENPNVTAEYVKALQEGSVRGPLDFAERYGAAAVGAAHDVHGLDDEDGDKHLAAASAAAQGLAGNLPTREDLADATLAISEGTDTAITRQNLLDHWKETGQQPVDAAVQARSDPWTMEKLTTPPDPIDPEPEAPGWATDFGAGFGDILSGAAQFMEKVAPGLMHTQGAGLLVQPGNEDMAAADLYNQTHLPDSFFADATKARLEDLHSQGIPDDSWSRIAGQMTATIPLVTNLGLSGAWAWVAAGATGALAQVAFSPTKAEDYWTEKGKEAAIAVPLGGLGGAAMAGGFKLLGKLISKMAPDAADHLAYIFRTLEEPKVPVTDPAAPLGTPPKMVPASEAFKPVEPAAFEPVAAPAEGAVAKEPAPLKFAEDATPASKIERIAQDTPENAPASPTFFRDAAEKLGVTDPETLALAEAHDTSATYLNWIKNVFSDIMQDESGALRLFPEAKTKAPSEERGAVILGKDVAEGWLRKNANGMPMQKVERIKQGFEPFRPMVAPHLPEWEAGLQAVYAAKGQMAVSAAVDSLKQTVIGRYIQAIEGHGVLAWDHPLMVLVSMRKALNGIVDDDLRAAMARGELQTFQMRDYYMSHIFDMGDTPVGGRGGSVGFTRQRSYDNAFDALEEGHKLRFNNPLDIDIASDQAKLTALGTLRVQALAKANNFIQSHADVKNVDPGWLPLTGLMSQKTVGIANNMSVTHQLYSPPGFARLYNNHIGFQDYTNASTTLKNFEDGLLRMKNLSTHLKLLMPLYHVVAEYKEGIAAGIGNSLIELKGGLKNGDMGELLRGMKDMALSLTAVKPAEYVATAGTKWRPMYRAAEQDPALAALNPELKAMQAFVAAGGNIAKRDNVYRESTTGTIWQSYARGELGQELKKDVTGITSILPRFKAADAEARSAVGLPFRELARLSTSISAPIWDHYIPLLKGGAAMERIQTYIRQNPGATEDALNFYAKQVVTQMEDRFGEYNMNNLFWRPGLRRATNQAMLSTSWTYGTVHSLLTGLGWNPGRGVEWNPVATADLMGHLATIAWTNAAWSYAIDGKLPDSYLDYLIPFANARGLRRVLLPGQEKEFYDWMGIVKKSVSVGMDQGVAAGLRTFSGQFAHYAFGKVAPIYQAAAEWVIGEDGIGHRLDYAPGGPIAFLKNAFMPIFIAGWDKAKADGLNVVENMIGIRGAPKWFEDWEAFRKQEQGLHAKWTKEELQRAGKEAIQQGNEPPEGYKPPGSASRSGQATAADHQAAARAALDQGRLDARAQRLEQQTLNRGQIAVERSNGAFGGGARYAPQQTNDYGTTVLRGNQQQQEAPAPRTYTPRSYSPARAAAIRNNIARRSRRR
jgi:hypothetical protein